MILRDASCFYCTPSHTHIDRGLLALFRSSVLFGNRLYRLFLLCIACAGRIDPNDSSSCLVMPCFASCARNCHDYCHLIAASYTYRWKTDAARALDALLLLARAWHLPKQGFSDDMHKSVISCVRVLDVPLQTH